MVPKPLFPWCGATFTPKASAGVPVYTLRLSARRLEAMKLRLFCCFALQSAFLAQAASVPETKVWPRPAIVPTPAATARVGSPVLSLDGAWKINTEPPAEFWSNSVDPSPWTGIRVPAHAFTQGVRVPRDRQYAYKRRFTVPADFAGQRIYLKFDGVTGQSKVWVNGVALREHFGGFTTWTCEVTEHVTPGREAWVTVGITDTSEGISSYNNGGMLRGVKLMAVPQDHVTRFSIETDFDRDYRDAVLKIWVAMSFQKADSARIDLSVRDPQGRPVALKPASIELTREKPETIVEIPVAAPVKWDAEHPNLYGLEARLAGGAETLTKMIGFRKVERVGRKLLVNGKEVKLRGVNRKDIYPLTGRSVPPEVCDEDIRLFRAANINFIRTSHYPTNQEMLDAADRYGMYIESETSVAFASNGVQDKPEFLPHFMNQFAEMIEKDRSHPSVILWSLANESTWGSNMQKEADYVRVEDPSRPVIFSWSSRIPSTATRPIDIYSYHYASYNSDLAMTASRPAQFREPGGQNDPARSEFPILHDEYAHLSVYDTGEQKRDPNVKNFWGESIKRFWENLFPTEGALGGATWGSVDNSSITPRGMEISRYDWGIIDGWRREKPEYWLMKKAYSPVRLDDKPVANPGRGNPIEVPIKNWFDHTNLSEVTVVWAAGRENGRFAGPNVEPHAAGTLRIPARNWRDGSMLNLKFYRLGGILVDEYNLPINPLQRALPAPQGPAPKIQEEQDRIVVTGADFSLVFSKRTGLIVRGVYKGSNIIESGPCIELGGVELPAWSLKRIAARAEPNQAVVNLSGSHGAAPVSFELRIDGQGLITTRYTLEAVPEVTRKVTTGVRADVGGFWEVGVSYVLSGEVDRLAWSRKGLWSAYPLDHIGRTSGVANREGPGVAQRFGVRPAWPWSQGEKDYIVFGRYDTGGRGSNDFRSMKENIYYASAILRGSKNRLQAVSEARDAVRLEVLDDPNAMIDDRDPRIRLSGSWTRMDGVEGNLKGTEMRSTAPGDSAELAFTGTGFAWLGSQDIGGGLADVYLDNRLEAGDINMSTRARQPSAILFSREGLANGPHTVRVVSSGKQSGSVVPLDGFKVLGGKTRGSVRFIVNNEWNYPQLGWGNYVKDPILLKPGYSNQVRLRFRDRDER